jgi:succinate dehydrogenase/fumarate reductase cytochrome b subunit
VFHAARIRAADNAGIASDRILSMEKLLIIAVLVVIVWNLGAGLYYMIVDKGTTNRTVRALSWRIGLSVGLILLVVLGIYTGVIKPHALQR